MRFSLFHQIQIVLFMFLLISIPAYAGNFLSQQDSVQTVSTIESDSWLGVDKAVHLTGSMILTTGVIVGLQNLANKSKRKSMVIGVGFTFTLGVGKEICDSGKRGNFFSYKDLMANIIGTCIGAVLVYQDSL